MEKLNARFTRLLLLVVLSLVLLACQTESAPTPTPTNPPRPTPTATTASPTVMATTPPLPTSAPSVTKLVDVRTLLSLTLPADWQMLELDGAALQNSLTALPSTGALPDPALLNRLQAALDSQSSTLVAWLNDPGGEYHTSLLVTALPRSDLRLESYLASAQAELAGQSNVIVHSAQIDVTLQAAGLPVGLLHYSLPASQNANPTDGWQVALLDTRAEHLVLLTFSTPSTQFAAHLPLFQEIVRTLAWA